jgi:hypothetical protein
MKLKLAALAIAALATAAVSMPAAEAKARKDAQTWPIADIFAHKDYASKVGDFKFTFGGKSSGAVVGDSQTRKATNGFGKSDHDACVWAALSALIAMKADAINRGGTSVQAIDTSVTETPFVSSTEFQCISGASNSRVYFKGKIVK